MQPWKTLATVATAEGALQLRQRGEREFMITIDGRVLMTSHDRRSELGLASLACQGLTGSPRVLIGGLGMAYTVRAALDALPPRADVVVAELTPVVVEWCKGPLAPLTNGALLDRRVSVVVGDVARVIADAPRGRYDAIILDLYEGPHAATQRRDDPFYGGPALIRSRAALVPGGVLAVWSEDPDAAFKRRFEHVGFAVDTHRLGKTRKHVVYLGRKLEQLVDGPARPQRPGARPARPQRPGAKPARPGASSPPRPRR
jgi:spermidine synthase